jgi:hypothetical protein
LSFLNDTFDKKCSKKMREKIDKNYAGVRYAKNISDQFWININKTINIS